MGRVRTKTVKKASRRIIEKYYMMLTLDFHTNKRVIEGTSIELSIFHSIHDLSRNRHHPNQASS